MSMFTDVFAFPLIVFLFGSAIGSFLNVVILRYLSGEGIMGRSHCPHCHTTLNWYELFPVISYSIQGGRCRHCHKSISAQYPIVELFTGIAAVVLFPNILEFIVFCLLIVLLVIDWRTYLLPDFFVLLLTVAVLLSGRASLFGLLIGAGFLLFLWAITSGKGIGFGDIKLMIPIGLFFGGGGTTLVLAAAFVVGGIIGLYLLITKQATRKTAIPFGPYLAGAAAILLLFPSLIPYALRWVLLT